MKVTVPSYTDGVSPSSSNIVDVEEFINRRWKKDLDWLNGNCYWFAKILTLRFPELELYYLPVRGHFVAGNDLIGFFDYNGPVYTNENCIKLSAIEKEDPLWYSHIMRDCAR